MRCAERMPRHLRRLAADPHGLRELAEGARRKGEGVRETDHHRKVEVALPQCRGEARREEAHHRQRRADRHHASRGHAACLQGPRSVGRAQHHSRAEAAAAVDGAEAFRLSLARNQLKEALAEGDAEAAREAASRKVCGVLCLGVCWCIILQRGIMTPPNDLQLQLFHR